MPPPPLTYTPAPTHMPRAGKLSLDGLINPLYQACSCCFHPPPPSASLPLLQSVCDFGCSYAAPPLTGSGTYTRSCLCLRPQTRALLCQLMSLDKLLTPAHQTCCPPLPPSLCVTSGGRMFIWGRASYGRLGLGRDARDAYAPVEVQLPGGHQRWKIAAATAGEHL